MAKIIVFFWKLSPHNRVREAIYICMWSLDIHVPIYGVYGVYGLSKYSGSGKGQDKIER